jgi:cobalamin biosynthesis Co2+ chelatase CbiK
MKKVDEKEARKIVDTLMSRESEIYDLVTVLNTEILELVGEHVRKWEEMRLSNYIIAANLMVAGSHAAGEMACLVVSQCDNIQDALEKLDAAGDLIGDQAISWAKARLPGLMAEIQAAKNPQ